MIPPTQKMDPERARDDSHGVSAPLALRWVLSDPSRSGRAAPTAPRFIFPHLMWSSAGSKLGEGRGLEEGNKFRLGVGASAAGQAVKLEVQNSAAPSVPSVRDLVGKDVEDVVGEDMGGGPPNTGNGWGVGFYRGILVGQGGWTGVGIGFGIDWPVPPFMNFSTRSGGGTL